MGFEVDVLEARAAVLERERDERAQAAVEAERARIARELHDVIGAQHQRHGRCRRARCGGC